MDDVDVEFGKTDDDDSAVTLLSDGGLGGLGELSGLAVPAGLTGLMYTDHVVITVVACVAVWHSICVTLLHDDGDGNRSSSTV